MNKKTFAIYAICFLMAMGNVFSSSAQATFNWPYIIEKGVIIPETPIKPEGQKSALRLIRPKLKTVRVGFVGLGMRGPGAVERWTHINGVQVMALCDHEKERAESCQNILRKASMPAADIYFGANGYNDLCKRKDIDLVYVATDWIHHFPIAKCALENGKNVAIEVPSAMNLEEIWTLINLAEQKQLHCMILENCCYDFFEMNTMNMAQNGVFGEIIRAQGAYIHDLSPYWEEYWKKDADDKIGWRLDYNMKHRGDVYATHGLGPIAQVLNIHRGDRMKTLIAMDTDPFNGPEKVKKISGKQCDSFLNGDHTTTLIRTEKGKVMEIQHDVLTPQPYNRLYQLTGTNGFANKYPVEGYALSEQQMLKAGVKPSGEVSSHSFLPGVDKMQLEIRYISPLVKKYGEEAREVGGHGGMDFIMDSRLVYCLQNGLPLDIDVYDLAEWCCLAELGSMSMNNGNLPVAIPDFTRGNWNKENGFKHAFATRDQEVENAKQAKEFTEQLKIIGKKYWEKYDKKNGKTTKK